MAFHLPHDMQAFCRMHKCEETSNWTAHTLAKLSWDVCTIVQEVPFGTCELSLKSGRDHSGTDRSCPVDAQGNNGEKHTGISEWQNAYWISYGRRPRDLMDPASMNPEQLTSTQTKQDPLNEKIQKLAMKTHLEVQQREDIRRDLAERMKFVPPHLRVRESFFHWQDDPSKIQQGRKSGKWLKVEIIAVKSATVVISTGASIFLFMQANWEGLSTWWIWKNFHIRVSGQEHLCCGSLVKVQHTRGSNNGQKLDQGLTWRIEDSKPCVGHYDKPSDEQFTEEYDCRCSVCHKQMRVIGNKEPIDPLREFISNCSGFFPHMAVLRRHFFAEYGIWVLYDSPRHPRRQFWHLCGQRWIHCLGAPIQLFSTAFYRRAWTMVVFLKEILGCQPQLITPGMKEEMRPIIHLRQNSLMILMFLLGLVDLRNLLDRQVHLNCHQDGLQLLRRLVIERGWNPEKLTWASTSETITTRASTYSKSNEWWRWWSVTTRRRGNGDGLDRVSEDTLVFKCHWNLRLNVWLLQKPMRY